MPFTYIRRAAAALALLASVSCTVKSTETPPLTGPSGLALSLVLNAIPDAISQDGGSQSSVKVLAIGPNGKPISGLPLRLDMLVGGAAQDYGTLSARSVVTNGDGIATAVYTAPPGPANGVFGTCNGLPGNCVSIVATPTATNFSTANPEQVQIRLVPTGVILPPADAPSVSGLLFTVTPASPSANSPAQFIATVPCGGQLDSAGKCPGTRTIVGYSWDFGDGQSATGAATSHVFALQRTYSVTLTVTNDSGNSTRVTQAVAVGSGALPTPAFTFSPATPGLNETVFFNAPTSTAGAGHSITFYQWAFGDGTTASGISVSHAYAAARTYTVQLTVTDETGQSATSAGTQIPVAVPAAPAAPTAAFTFSPTLPRAGTPVNFNGSTSSASVVSWQWDFGDGVSSGTSSVPTVAHTFAAGTWNVTLIVRDANGQRGTATVAVTVAP